MAKVKTKEEKTELAWSAEWPTEPGYYLVQQKDGTGKGVVLLDASGTLRSFGAKTYNAEFKGPFPKPPIP